MADFITELGENISAEVGSGIRAKNINKEDFKENLQMLISRYTTILDMIGSLTETDRVGWANRIYNTSNEDKTAQFCKMYVNLSKQLGAKDLKVAFDSFKFTALNYKKMLDVLDKSINEIFKEKVITVFNSKLSSIAIFGLLKDATVIANYTIYMLHGIGYEITQHRGTNELDRPKKYRFAYCERNYNTVLEILKQMIHGTGAYMFANGVTALRRSNNDVNLVDENNRPNLAFITPNSLTAQVTTLLKTGVKGFGIFRWLGEQWNLIKHAKYRKAQMEKEWIESHVALLKLELANVDPNSPEYQKQVKIINSYSEMIAQLDQKIDEYEND